MVGSGRCTELLGTSGEVVLCDKVCDARLSDRHRVENVGSERNSSGRTRAASERVTTEDCSLSPRDHQGR